MVKARTHPILTLYMCLLAMTYMQISCSLNLLFVRPTMKSVRSKREFDLSCCCPKHNGAEYVLYCRDCEGAICRKCLELHRRHYIMDLEAQYLEAQTSVENLCERIKGSEKKLQEEIDSEEIKIKNQTEIKEKALSDIKKKSEESVNLLEQKMEKMTAVINAEFALKSEPHHEYIESLKNGLKRCEAVKAECHPPAKEDRQTFIVMNKDLIESKLSDAACYAESLVKAPVRQSVKAASPAYAICTHLLVDSIDKIHFEASAKRAQKLPMKDRDDQCPECDLDIVQIISALTAEQAKTQRLQREAEETATKRTCLEKNINIMLQKKEENEKALEKLENENDALKRRITELEDEREEKKSTACDYARSLLATFEQPTHSSYSSAEMVYKQATLSPIENHQKYGLKLQDSSQASSSSSFEVQDGRCDGSTKSESTGYLNVTRTFKLKPKGAIPARRTPNKSTTDDDNV